MRLDSYGKTCAQVVQTLKSNYANANFEHVIAVLEELEPIAAAQMSRPMADEFRPVVAGFLSPGDSLAGLFDPDVLRETRHLVLQEITQECVQRTAQSNILALKLTLQRLSSVFSLSVFTLNYDDLIDLAANLNDGFTVRHNPTGNIPWARSVLRFDAPNFIKTRGSGRDYLAHLHGNVRFGYQIECDGIVKYDKAADALAAVYTTRTSGSVDHGNVITAGPIISGFNKVAKLAGNPEPYAQYYAAFTDALMSNNRLLVIGYGGMDSYVNAWLNQFGKTHGSNGRVAWITKIPGRDVGGGRADIKLLKDLAGKNGIGDSVAYVGGRNFQVQGRIALGASGFPLDDTTLGRLVEHLSA